MASVFVLLEAFNRKEAAALGFFPCATASYFFVLAAEGRHFLPAPLLNFEVYSMKLKIQEVYDGKEKQVMV